MDFEKIVYNAMPKAVRSAVAKSDNYSLDIPEIPSELKEIAGADTPIIKYINALVAESLRLYHEDQHTPR